MARYSCAAAAAAHIGEVRRMIVNPQLMAATTVRAITHCWLLTVVLAETTIILVVAGGFPLGRWCCFGASA
jgi:hypothetical protein